MKKVFLACHVILFFAILITPAAHSGTMRRDSLCTSIKFRQGYSIVEPDFAGNRASLERMEFWLDSLENTSVSIRQIIVKGSASPEGYTPHNRILSRKRAESIGRLLLESRSIPDSIIKVADSDVDWELLRRLVLASGQPWSEEAARIIAETPVWIFDKEGRIIDGKKRRLSTLGGGKPWYYMAEHFFPTMRNAGYAIICEYETGEPEVAPAPPAATVADAAMTASPQPVPPEAVHTDTDESVACRQPALSPRRLTALLKTNMLYDAAAVPSLAVEIALGDRWSVEAGWSYAGWKSDTRHRSWCISLGEIGIRYWFGPRRGDNSRLTGHHVGIYGQMLTYDFQFGGKGEIADKWNAGAGIAYGYSLPVARHLNIDFTVGAGWLGGKYQKYHPMDNCDVWDATYSRKSFSLTKAEVSLVWYIGGNPARKGGRQ